MALRATLKFNLKYVCNVDLFKKFCYRRFFIHSEL